MSYIELRAKTNFSFLTGASHPYELVQQALELNLAGIALTDVDGVYGMPRGYRVAKENPLFKYICGTELTFYDHAPLTVLAKNRAAYACICQLITHAKTGQQKGQTHLSIQTFLQKTSGALASSFILIPRLESQHPILWAPLKNQFQSDIYLPLTFYQDGHDETRIQHLLALKASWNLELVATNDVEYHVKKRKLVQDVLISIREGQPLTEIGFKIRGNGERYIKSPHMMNELYTRFPDALAQTHRIAQQCTFSPRELKYRYPSEWIPHGFTGQTYLEHLVAQHSVVKGLNQKMHMQLDHELKLIKELDYADYFLTIYDIVRKAHELDILCQGRGSAANSAVCFVLGITAINPVQMNLLFERFISAERGEPPDIDIDFEHERREEIIQYMYEKYGRHRAGMVSAVVTYQYRNAFRDVCKAFGVPVGTLSAKKVERQFDELIHDHPHKEGLTEKISYIAGEMQGFPRHLSIHSGGFTLSADPIIDIVPIEPARREGRTIIQWDKYDLDILGLIKVDVLSLGMLSCLSKALKLTKKKLYELPADDAATYAMIQQCDTVGTFQVESRAQMSMLGRLKPKNFYDLVVQVAIVRPGPIVGNMVHPYLKRRNGLERVAYPNKKVEEILGKTMGVPLFQEQVMKLAIDLAGFTPGESDLLRKSINAWRTSRPIGEMGERLRRGLIHGGMTPEFAAQMFEQIQGFSHYGFPESHAASFALLAYASCYLKCHHPAEFACSLVNSQPMGFYRNDTIIYDAIRHGVRVLPLSLNTSEWDCTIEGDNTIRIGFRAVKGLSHQQARELIAQRNEHPFLSLTDFMKRSPLRADITERLALANRFEDFNWEARDALWAILSYEHLLNEPPSTQLSFFSHTTYLEKTELSPAESHPFSKTDGFEKIQNDYGAFSLSLQGHPMSELRKTMSIIPKMTSQKIRELRSGSLIKTAGLVLIRQKPPTANGTCFSTLEDEYGFIDLVLFPDTFEKYNDVFLNHCFIIVTGTMEREGNTVSVIVSSVAPLWQTDTLHNTPLALEPDQYFWG
ncbi:MAG: error-prone DNA polymerase [Bdellovibrionaceae bacterium]|nr:error-prone DNA polymerase [Pseudobdellovibrionaceae bacterium]